MGGPHYTIATSASYNRNKREGLDKRQCVPRATVTRMMSPKRKLESTLAVLLIKRGGVPGTLHPLDGDTTVLGRSEVCDVAIDFISISRKHAQITHRAGRFFLEDLKSRNGTLLNGQAVQGEHELSEGDEIEICDVLLSFHVKEAPPEPHVDRPAECATLVPELADEASPESSHDSFRVGQYVEDLTVSRSDGDSSSIVTTIQADDSSRNIRLSINAEAKLRAIIGILQQLRTAVSLDQVLQSILSGLFTVFTQAQQGFIMLHDPKRDRLKLEATRAGGRKQAEVNVSMTIVRKAMESGEAILSADAADDSRFNMSESLQNLSIRSLMCVPLLGQDDKRLGVLQLDTNKLTTQFAQEDLDVLLAVATPVALAIANARLLEQELETKALKQTLALAGEIQQNFLPSEMPDTPGYEIAHFYEAAEDVGGDYFDCFELSEGRICLAVGDVAGKGVPASLLMARVYSAVRAQMMANSDPAATMSFVNNELAMDQTGFRFVTLVMTVLDLETGELQIVNAGHTGVLLADSDGDVRRVGVEKGGLPLGLQSGATFEITRATLQTGGRMAMYSDGLTEASDRSGKLFGRERLANVLRDPERTAEKLVTRIMQTVEEFRSGGLQEDDCCLAVVRRLNR